MTLVIHPYVVKICHQHLNITKSAKNEPYLYKVAEIKDNALKDITGQTLSCLLLQAQNISSQIQMELIRREDKSISDYQK